MIVYNQEMYDELVNSITSIKDANLILIKRYKSIVSAFCQTSTRPKELGMCEALLENPDWPIDKVSRWIGFIQRGLIDAKMTSVDFERDFSRGLFHAAYKAEGIEIPESFTVN